MHWSFSDIMFSIFTLCLAWVIFGAYRNERKFTAYMLLMLGMLWAGAVLDNPFQNQPNALRTVESLPDEFVFMGGVVEEANASQPGRITLTVIIKERPDVLTFYQVPYSPGLASDVRELNRAVQITGKGIPVGTKSTTKPTASEEGFKA